jgi:hypothetical protein
LRGTGIITLIYLVVGVLVAAAKDYFGDVSGIFDLVNILLAILLWPLVLLGVDFDLGGKDGGGKKKDALLLLGPSAYFVRERLRERVS